MSDVTVRLTLTDDASSKLRGVASAGRAAAAQLSSIGRTMDNAFSSNAPSNFASEAGSAISSVSSQAEGLGNAIDSAVDGLESANIGGGLTSQLSGAASSASELSNAAGQAESSVDNLAGAAGGLGSGLDGLDDGADDMEDLADSADDAGDSMENASGSAGSLTGALKGLFAAIGGAVVLDKIKDFGAESVEAFSGLETGMAEVSTLLSSDADIGGMTDQVRQFSQETGKLTSEVVPALYQSISASVPQDTVFDFLETANQAAVGGVTDLETAVDGITSVINAYGTENLSAAQASDQMFTAVKLGKTTFGELANSLFNVIPTAVNAGVSFGDVTAAIATMTASGTPTSVATTQMRQALVELSDTGSQVGETFQTVAGKGFKEFIAEGHNTGDALNLLDEYAKGAGLTIDQLFSSVEAGNAAAQLTGGHAKTFADDIAAMGASAGATEEAYNKMTDTYQHKTELLATAMEDVKLSAGEELQSALSPAIDSLLENMDDIKEPVVDFFGTVGDIISELAPLLPGVLNTMSSGLSAVGKAIGPLFKTMAGNPEAVGAGLTTIATGMLALKAVNAASGFAGALQGVTGIGGALKVIAPAIFSNPWAAGAAGVVAALTAIGFAVHEYNKQQIDNSLSEHFGDVELSAAQIEAAAGHILNAQYLVNIQGALNEFTNADQLAEQAQAALSQNDALEWKASIGMEWNEDDVTTYVNNIDTFIESSVKELESRTHAATITINTMIGGTEEGKTLVDQMEQWALSDQLEMETLSQQLQSAVEKAMEDGVLNASEQAAISILQTKMNNILSSWKESESQGALDLINQKYGSMSGKDLTPETFTSLVEELGDQREEALQAVDDASTEVYSSIRGLMNSGRLSEDEGEHYIKMVGEAARNMQASSLLNSVNFENQTISDTYGEQLEKNYASMESDTKGFMENARNLFASNDVMGVFDTLNFGASAAQTYSGLFSSADQKALSDIWDVMKPDANVMGELIQEYQHEGQKIPESFMQSYNEAMMVGAASGDSNAAWQVFANQMVADPANDALVQAIQDGTQSAPEELKNALNIALAETTTDPVQLSDLTVSLASMDLDVGQIAELTGMTEAEVQAILDEQGIEVEQEVDVSTKAGQVDGAGAEQAGQAADEAAKSAAGGSTDVEKQANVTYTEGTTDTSQVENAATAELESGTAEKTIVADTTYVPGTTDTSQVTEVTQEGLSNQTIDSTATANVTAQVGQTNFSEVASSLASSFGSAVTAAFNKTFTASTNVSITVNYSIANPTHTISFSGGGTGTATVHAHASGGYFTEPHLGMVAEAGYGEYIIPMDGSDNAESLWKSAGEQMGMLDAPITTMPAISADGMTGGGNSTVETKETSTKDINLNINGNGRMQISSGMSKEEIVKVLLENMKDALIGIVEQEILEEGDGVYEY